MRLVLAGFLVSSVMLASVAPAVACDDEEHDVAQAQQPTQRTNKQAQKARKQARQAQRQAMREARRAMDQARRDIDRQRRDFGRAQRAAEAMPLPNPMPDPRPQVDTQQKLERLQRKLDKLRQRMERFAVPKPVTMRAPVIEIRPEGADWVIDVDGL